jgi:hypothetical protein
MKNNLIYAIVTGFVYLNLISLARAQQIHCDVNRDTLIFSLDLEISDATQKDPKQAQSLSMSYQSAPDIKNQYTLKLDASELSYQEQTIKQLLQIEVKPKSKSKIKNDGAFYLKLNEGKHSQTLGVRYWEGQWEVKNQLLVDQKGAYPKTGLSRIRYPQLHCEEKISTKTTEKPIESTNQEPIKSTPKDDGY